MCYDIAKAVQLVSTEVQEFFTGTDENGETNGENSDENGEIGEPVEFFPADSTDSDDSNEF